MKSAILLETGVDIKSLLRLVVVNVFSRSCKEPRAFSYAFVRLKFGESIPPVVTTAIVVRRGRKT
jgi:hypothetical protein